MSNILLDTHIAIWALNDDEELPEKARDLILDPDNTIYYSTVSVWEVALKHARRPEAIPFNEQDFSASCKDAGFNLLDIREKHIFAMRYLPIPKKDTTTHLTVFCWHRRKSRNSYS